MNNKLSMLEVEAMLNIEWDEMFLPEYTGINGAEFPYVVAAEIATAEAEAKAVIAEVITEKAAVADRRKATAKKEKQYKAAKAEHISKSNLIGSKRYNGEYTPYKRVRNYSLIDEAYAEIEDMELLAIEEESYDNVLTWKTIAKKNEAILDCENRITSLTEVKNANVDSMLENFNVKFYEAAVVAHEEIKKAKEEIIKLNNEIQNIIDSLEY